MAGMSHVMDKQLTILKRDGRGRVRSTPQMRREAVAEYQRSGLSASAFAKMAGISKNTFWNWLNACGLTQKRTASTRRAASISRAPAVRFMEAVVADVDVATTHSTLHLQLPGGASVMVRHSAQIELAARLLKSLT